MGWQGLNFVGMFPPKMGMKCVPPFRRGGEGGACLNPVHSMVPTTFIVYLHIP